MSQFKVALKVANDRRIVAEDTLNQMLADPVLTTQGAPTSNKSIKNENEALNVKLKRKELQMDMLSQMFLQKYKEFQ